MPERESPIGNVDVRELPTASLTNLAARAREAYGQKRTKDCLDLTRAILLIDPENPEAQLMRSAIRAEMHQDLENAQALVRSAQMKDSTEIVSRPESPLVTSPYRPDTDAAAVVPAVPEPNPSPIPIPSETAEEPPASPKKSVFVAIRAKQRQWLKRASVVLFIGLAAVGLPQGLRKSSSFVQILPTQVSSAGSGAITDAVPEALPAAVPSTVDQSPKSPKVDPPRAAGDPVAPESPFPLPIKLREKPVNLAASGTLAISSPTSVDIYMNDLYVGSAPVSLEVSAGSQTLEYRHGNLRKKVTHVINSNETTRAMITFDVTLQINAKPWAEVFLDGIDRKPLGQTPLGGVRVPIGAVLVFENPGFEPKKYRVTGSEAGIQIVFP